MLWLFDPNARTYRDGQPVGRGTWTCVEVRRAGRQSVEIGDEAYPERWRKFALDTGKERARVRSGYPIHVYGYAERAEHWWHGEAHRLSKQIDNCRDIETLKAVAHLLDCAPPPDFTRAPDPTGF